jgi:aspartate/methionine/tyrosine aminotransferase
MPTISSKTDLFTESIIRQMTRIALQYDAINLSQGFPDFDPPALLMKELERTAITGPHQYAITWGAVNFRKALAAKQEKLMGLELDPDENIVVTCGSTEAMMAAMLTVCNPGDKVIVFSPFYENYAADTILSGAEPIYIPLSPPNFHFDEKVLRNAFAQKPKALILCNPSNPSGKVFTRNELQVIARLSQEYDTFVITDEVYEHIVYAPNYHTYIASLPGMFKRTISCSSLSKTYSITGWRLGYVIADKYIINGVKKVHDFLTVGAAAPLQEAAVVGLNMPEEYYRNLIESYTKKRDIFLDHLEKANLTYIQPAGAYYVLVDIEEFAAKNDMEFCTWLIKEIGVAAVPGSSFFHENIQKYIRFHFAKKEETLRDAGKRLLKLKPLTKS